MRDLIERANEATKIQKIQKIKREKGATLLVLFKRSTLVLQVALVLHREFSYHSCITKGDPYAIELGLYIPMMSLLKRALGLLDQASWMHPH